MRYLIASYLIKFNVRRELEQYIQDHWIGAEYEWLIGYRGDKITWSDFELR
ncbi:hypothetical protein [Paraglaciecola sp.]|uniref:hypothetical protein n=1 Tax=Paraglaciecola sp. TaxID=1920173 RepID=UPI0030F43D8D